MKSTTTAGVNFVNNMINEVDGGKFASALFLSKAFDCVDVNLLLDKLFNLGFRELGEVIKSYMTNRHTWIFSENGLLTHQKCK